MKTNIQRVLSFIFIASAVTMLTGCGTLKGGKPKPVAWTVVVTKSTAASIEVDLIGVTSIDRSYWLNTVKPDDYWKTGNTTRANARKTGKLLSTKFEQGRQWSLTEKDPVWATWFAYGAGELLVFADLPGRNLSNDPNDPRRLFLTLDKKAWDTKERVLNIIIEDERIYTTTPPRQK